MTTLALTSREGGLLIGALLSLALAFACFRACLRLGDKLTAARRRISALEDEAGTYREWVERLLLDFQPGNEVVAAALALKPRSIVAVAQSRQDWFSGPPRISSQRPYQPM